MLLQGNFTRSSYLVKTFNQVKGHQSKEFFSFESLCISIVISRMYEHGLVKRVMAADTKRRRKNEWTEFQKQPRIVVSEVNGYRNNEEHTSDVFLRAYGIKKRRRF